MNKSFIIGVLLIIWVRRYENISKNIGQLILMSLALRTLVVIVYRSD